jgi:hypothetical protein
MTARHRLQGGLARRFPDHRGTLARAYRADYEALCASLSINGDMILRREAERVAFLGVRAAEANRAWAELVEKRRQGRGRRASPREIERARRAAALDDNSYQVAADRLRELAGRRPTLTVSEAIAAQRKAGGA